MRTLARWTIGAIIAVASWSVSAQGWPSRPVRILVPAAPGGNPDVIARVLAAKLSDSFGRPFVAENVPGLGGAIATEQVARTVPDGHTLLIGDSGALAISPALNPKLPYQPLRDLAPITALAAVPTLLILHPGANINSLAELVARAKARPGEVSFGSAGNGSIHHLTMAIFAARMGVEFLHVPYKGGSPMVAGVMAGDVAGGFSGIPNVMQAIRGGKLKTLGISTAKRSASMPEVPTLLEQGVRDFDVASVMGLAAAAGTPKEIIARLQPAVASILREKEVVDRLTGLGLEIAENGTEHYAKLLKTDLERYASAVRDAKLNVQ